MSRKWVERHKKIVQLFRASPFNSIQKISREIGSDSRTVRRHLEVLEIDGAGEFIDQNYFINYHELLCFLIKVLQRGGLFFQQPSTSTSSMPIPSIKKVEDLAKRIKDLQENDSIGLVPKEQEAKKEV